mmetsp:Transcript_22313/g.33862  ORF Transcript_22313/g.33862 Transcript_22313/m.33862 type:complete len:472 (+) Transcript_22313:56-1471(+)
MTEGENGILTLFKNAYSIVLLIISIVLITGLIFTKQTALSSKTNPVVAFILLWVTVLWLSTVEGSQASLVGLSSVDKELYKENHSITYKITSITNKGDNLDRYLLGRQLMVVFLIFLINFCGDPIENATLWGLPGWFIDIFLDIGFAMILFTCMVGQLNTQVNASLYMIDYVNNYFALFTFWVAMCIECTGILHICYAVKMIIIAIAAKTFKSKEEPRGRCASLFFWFRVFLSFSLVVFCFFVTFAALFEGKTEVWKGVPHVVAILMFFTLLTIVGLLEGMQIAFFAVAKLHESERGVSSSKFAKLTCDLLYNQRDGLNLPAFMIGRQLCVVSCYFVIAHFTTQKLEQGDTNVLNFPDMVQAFLDTGLCGALVTTVIGSVSWQLVADAFPFAFLSTPFTYIMLRMCLVLEATGICNGAWILAGVHKRLAGFQNDDIHIGTAEERATQKRKDAAARETDLSALTGADGLKSV